MKKSLGIHIFVLLSILLFSYLYSRKTLVLFPSEIVTLNPYTDNEGSTIDSFSTTPNGIYLSGTLDALPQYPVVGLRVTPLYEFINLSSFQTLEIETKNPCSDFNLTLTAFEERFSKKEENNTHRYLQLDTKVQRQGDTLGFNIKKMPIPAWWYSMNEVTREEFGAIDYSKITSIIISNHPKSKPLESISIHIERMAFYRDRMLPIKLALLYLLLTAVGTLILKARSKTEIRHIQVLPQDVQLEPKEQKVLGAIAASYSDKNLTITLLASETGVSQYHIRKMIQQEFHCTFTAYLKLVRILEAERLLRESDVDIKEIAYRTGFTHPSAFNRAFKERNGISPSQFRTEKS